MNINRLRLCILILTFLLSGCTSRSSLAPVVESTWERQRSNQSTHIVRAGETLYAVAFRYDRDYRQLAIANHLRPPYSLRVGQILQIRGKSQRYFARPRYVTGARYPAAAKRRPVYVSKNKSWGRSIGSGHWLWPVKGRIAAGFVPEQGKKGIDIAGNKGEKIRAASNGVVAYAGNGLSGYGNLIIIKHDNQFLTAYGNNLRNTVREGQKVKAGQIIAEMGVVDRRFWGVHFEIRKAGKPVNPLSYLQNG